jgi:hypothetical protein
MEHWCRYAGTDGTLVPNYRLARIESITAGFNLGEAEAEAEAPAVPATA